MKWVFRWRTIRQSGILTNPKLIGHLWNRREGNLDVCFWCSCYAGCRNRSDKRKVERCFIFFSNLNKTENGTDCCNCYHQLFFFSKKFLYLQAVLLRDKVCMALRVTFFRNLKLLVNSDKNSLAQSFISVMWHNIQNNSQIYKNNNVYSYNEIFSQTNTLFKRIQKHFSFLIPEAFPFPPLFAFSFLITFIQ